MRAYNYDDKIRINGFDLDNLGMYYEISLEVAINLRNSLQDAIKNAIIVKYERDNKKL